MTEQSSTARTTESVFNTAYDAVGGIVRPTAPRRLSASPFDDADIIRKLFKALSAVLAVLDCSVIFEI